MTPPTPLSPRLRALLAAYRLGWLALLPLAFLYLWLRGRRDPRYRRHWAERLGGGPGLAGAVWVHAVSLGEMRSAVPLVRALLDRGETVVTTHLTPAGRQACTAAFGPEIAASRVLPRYLPVEAGFAWRRLYRAFRPKLWLVLEIEIWPVMIAEARAAGVPLLLANSQIPERSLPRARRLARLAGHPVAGVTGVLAKSARHAARFAALGAPEVSVCGELRFDQPVPPAQTAAATALRRALAGRGAVTLASVVAGEDALYLDAMERVIAAARVAGRPPPLFVHVPRAPERFDETAALIAAAGLRLRRRSEVLDAALNPNPGSDPLDTDVLLGDSMGEMYFYLGLGDLAVVGGGFVPKGAHNVIEPLAMRRPVLVGPHVWTIEYPGQEAQAAGLLEICADAEALAARIDALIADQAMRDRLARAAEAFLADHAGATARSLGAIAPCLDRDAARP